MLDTLILGLETPLTIGIAVIAFIIVIWAQVRVNGSFNKFKTVKNSKGISGFEVARTILDKYGLHDVHVVETEGVLSDHYDPKRKVVRLSRDIFHGETIAGAAVAAHEVGHAIQDHTGYTFLKIRAFLFPIVNLVTYVGYIMMIISLFSGLTGYLMFGIVLIGATLLFQLVTLPVEFDASKRANAELQKLNLVSPAEVSMCKKMLDAAAFTYVAGVISSILNLLRLIIMAQNRD